MGDVKQKLQIWKSKQDVLKKDLGYFYRSKDEFEDVVFTSTMGSPMVRYIAEKTINEIVKEINFEENIIATRENREPVIFEHMHPHSIRHSFCCRCFEMGMNPKVVQALLGHGNLGVTMNVYLHMSQTSIKSEATKLLDLSGDYANYLEIISQNLRSNDWT